MMAFSCSSESSRPPATAPPACTDNSPCSARDSSSCRNCAYDSVWIASSGGTSRMPWRLPKLFRIRFFSVNV
jgi:hypothetical protein